MRGSCGVERLSRVRDCGPEAVDLSGALGCKRGTAVVIESLDSCPGPKSRVDGLGYEGGRQLGPHMECSSEWQ
jgi:hypothetical protein